MSYPPWAWWRCPACEFGFLQPYIGESRQDSECISSAYDAYLAEATRPFAEEKSLWVQRFLGGSIRHVLEVGPGAGQLARALLRQVPGLSYLGIESQDRFLRDLDAGGIPRRGQDIGRETDFRALLGEFSGDRPALVVFDNVLEHLEHPAEIIRSLYAAFVPGSIILAEVPNEKWIREKTRLQDFLRGQRKSPTFPGHINLFTRRNLARMMSGCGIRDYQIRGRPIRADYHVQYLMQALEVPPRARLAIRALRFLPVDTLLGLEYWLRLSVVKRA